MCPYNLMVWGVIVAGLILGLVAVSFFRASNKKLEETLALALSDPELHWKEKKNTFEYQGLDFRYEEYAGSRNSSPSFSVSVECPGTGGEFDIWEESAFERFFKNIGVTREIQTPEEAFDRRFYIASDTPPIRARLFRVRGKTRKGEAAF